MERRMHVLDIIVTDIYRSRQKGVMASCMKKRPGKETGLRDLRGTFFGVKLTLAPFNCSEASGRIGKLRLPQGSWQ